MNSYINYSAACICKILLLKADGFEIKENSYINSQRGFSFGHIIWFQKQLGNLQYPPIGFSAHPPLP